MLRLSFPAVGVFLSLAMLPVDQAFADCSSLTETSSSRDAATVARVSFDDSCPKPLGLFASITTVDGETIADREIPIGDDLDGTATVDLATWLDPQSRSGVYSIAWRAQLADGSSSTLDQLFTIPCPAPPAVTHRLLPGSNRLIVAVPTGDICQGDTVAILNLLDVLGNAVGDPVTQTFPSAVGQDLSFDLSALEGERRYTGLLSMRNDSGETTESEFTFLTGCGPLQASGALDGPRITGALAASSCHFPVNITVRVLNSDGQEIKTGEAVLNDRDFDLLLPDYEQWAAGEYSVVADFVSSEGRRSSLNLDAQVDCQAPSLSGVSIDSTSNANQAMLLATYQSTDACQGESQINLQLRNSDNTVVFNRTLMQQPSTLPVPLSFPLNAIPGSTYELVATLRYGSLQSEETIVTEKLFFECTEPAILDFGYSKPDASGLGALIRLSSCNLPAVAKIQVSEPSGRIVASNEVELVESPNGAYSVVPEASIRHLPTGKYSARLVFSDNQSRSLTEELDVDRDVEGPSIAFQHQDQLIDENTIPTVSRLENLAVSYSDPSSLLPSSVPYSDQLSSLKVEEAHSVIREISGESGAELWFSGYVELPRTVEEWGFVGVLIEDSQGNRWLAPVTRRFVPVQAENLSGFHPSNHRSGFRSVIRTSSLSPGSYRVIGVMVSIGGRELLAQGQSPFNISSFSTRQTNAILRRGVTERQLTLDFQTTQTAVFSAVSAIPDGTYSLQVTGQDRYGNSSEPRILVFNYKQEKDQRLVNMPAIAGQSVVLKHQFVSTQNGRPYDRPVRIVVKRFSGTGAIKINDRTVDSQIIEFLAAPTTDATFPIKLELVTSDVDAKYVLQPDSPELRPLEVVFTSYEPDFELIREDTPAGETLTVSNRSSSCSRFSVFSNLSELNVSTEETLCALRISHPSIRVTKTTSATTTLEWSASEDLDIPYEIGFVRKLGSNVSFHKLSEHSLAELKSLSLSPTLSFEQSSSLKERGRGLVTRTGQFRPGSIVVRAEKPNAIIEINGERPFAPLQVGLHRLPLETNVSAVGDTQRLLVRSFYEPTPAHVAEKAFTFVAVPPPVDVSAVNAQLVAPEPLFIDFRVDAVDSDYKPDLHGGYEVRQALVISRLDTSSNPRSVTASLTEAGLIHVALPALDPGSYRIQLTIANADPAVSEHLLPVVSDSSFEVLDGSPIQSHVFTFRSSDSVPFLGHLALDLDDPQRVDDLSTTIWEVSADGKRYQRFQQGPSSIDFALREPSARFFRARLINRHSQADFATDPIKVSAYSQTYLSIQGPHQTFRGWPIELSATGVDPGSVVWRVTPPGGDSPEELTAPSITIDPVITGQYFVEAIAKDPAYGADALSSQRVFKTIDVQWAKIPPALISGPTQVELGRAETFKVSHPPIFDGEGNSSIRRVGEWELPNGDVIPDQEWVEFTLEDLPEGDTYANIFYHAWIDGARESTLVTAVHRVKPYSYRWPEWEIHAETISSTLPSVYRLSVRPTQWRQWFDTSDTAIQTSWQLPGQARVRHRTDRELIVEISQDRSFTARATVTDSRGNVSEIQADDLYPIRTLPFDVAARIVPERSLHTAPIKVEASIEAILLPDDRPVTRVAYYLDEFYAGATDGGPIQLEIRSPGEHRIRAIASVDNEFVAEDTVLFDVSENLPAICNIQPVGEFSLNGVAKAECEDPDGQMVEYRWYLNGQLINATGSRVQLDRRQIQDAAELSLIAIDNAGKEATARYLPEVGG